MTIHSETNNTVRLEYIDWAKGVMILLVIVGHLCQLYLVKGRQEPLFHFIYTFHMPLFFLLSGYVMGVTQHKLQSQTFKTWIWHKVQSLLIPFIIWGLLVYRFIDPISTSPLNLEALRRLILYPDQGGVWFLISLLCIQVVCYPVFRYERIYAWLVPIAFVIVGLLLGGSFFYCNPHHYACFLAGYIFFKHQDYVYRTDVATAALLCFIIAEKVYPHPVLCTLSAGVALLFVCRRISNVGGNSCLTKNLNIIGQNTMAIYLLHPLIVVPVCVQQIDISSFRMTPIFIIMLVISYIVALICVSVVKVMNHFPLLNYLLFGKSRTMLYAKTKNKDIQA